MRIAAVLSGVGGGILAVISSGALLLIGEGHNHVLLAWLTLIAGLGAILGGAVARTRPLLAALLMAVAFMPAAFLAGVVRNGAVIAGVDTAQALLVAGAIVAFLLGRDRFWAGPQRRDHASRAR